MQNILVSSIVGFFGSGIWLIVAFVAAYIFRDTLKEALKRSVSRDIEKLRHEFAKDIEKYKHDLDATKGRLQHELQREMIKAELHSNKIQELYPVLFEKLRIAEGKVEGCVGVSYANTWEGYGHGDFVKVLEQRNVPSQKKEQLLNKISVNREEGIRELDRFLFEWRKEEALRAVIEAKNEFVLKSLYISRSVYDLAILITSELHSAIVDIRLSSPGHSLIKEARESLKVAEADIEKLEKLMRDELHPRG